MKILSAEAEKNAIMTVAELMCAAVRTAPKAKGMDNIAVMILTGADKNELENRMREIAETGYRPNTFIKNAGDIKQAAAVVMIGTKTAAIGLDCGFCGFGCCAECMEAGAVCSYNAGDLGIAIGSAAAIAADFHIDNRILYTAGYAAVKYNLMGNEIKIAFGIPLAATGKNIFFDRKP